MRAGQSIGRLHAAAFRVPTYGPESDGTLAWNLKGIVVVQAEAGGRSGLGYTYGARQAADLVNDTLASPRDGTEAFDIGAAHQRMRQHVRNMGAAGIAATAISAVDIALWDLKAKLLGL